jgi:hypothetical protein
MAAWAVPDLAYADIKHAGDRLGTGCRQPTLPTSMGGCWRPWKPSLEAAITPVRSYRVHPSRRCSPSTRHMATMCSPSGCPRLEIGSSCFMWPRSLWTPITPRSSTQRGSLRASVTSRAATDLRQRRGAAYRRVELALRDIVRAAELRAIHERVGEDRVVQIGAMEARPA